ncbi:MAG: class I SAM-dependent methyltransferase [Thermoanaerobaculia bacterium]
MGLYSRYVLPRIVHLVCSGRQMMRQRASVVPEASGRVLEIGVGSGLNLALYDRTLVDRVVGIDRSAEMLALAASRAASASVEVELVEAAAESIPLESGSIDTIVVTWSLCSVSDLAAATAEMHRVLAGHGRLLFCEHGIAPDLAVRRWQERLNPVWRILSGGCSLDVDVPARLSEAGFDVELRESAYQSGFTPASFNYRGIAR